MLTKQGLSIEDAKRVAAAAIEKAKAQNWLVAVAIADEGGNPMYMERMDHCQPASPEIAAGKARTAVLFKRPTMAIENAGNGPRPVAMMLTGATPLGGGVPLKQGDEIVGAIGISGLTPQQDEEVASAGAAAL